jgi:tRNA-specific 2-thiouridylase
MFPVGDQPKGAVREHARRLGLPVAEKPDSQEICFVPDDDYAAFVGRRGAALPGPIVDEHGRVLGTHDGIHHFTIGQRKGLGLSSSPTGAPMYVLALQPDAGAVVVGPRKALERTSLTASGVNWIVEPTPAPRQVTAQIRHRHRAAAAIVRPLPGGRAETVFAEPQLAITPGQAVVWYDGDVVVGGGWIE